MLNWLSLKVLHNEQPPVRRTIRPIQKTTPKGDEDFDYFLGLSADAIEVEELSLDEFMHYFKQK